MSACVTVCVAAQTREAPGASVAGIAGVHVPSTAPTPASVTVTPVSVWLPVLVTVIEYVITLPTASYGPAEVGVLVTVRAGFCVIGTVALALSGGVWSESPVAVFAYVPASMSACVTVCVAVHTTDAFGASVAGVAGVHAPSTAPTPASVTVTPVRVTLPVFVTRIA